MPSYNYHARKFNKSSTYQLAKAAYSTANYVKDMVNIEYKVYRIETTPTTFNNLGVIYDLIGSNSGFAGIQQGITVNDRIGDSIKLQRMVFRGLIQKNAAATINSIRIIVFQGKAEAGLMYSTADILESTNVYSGKNENNRYNTKVLYDEVKVIDSVKSQYLELDWNIELNWHAKFEAGVTTIADGGLYMLLLTGASVNLPSWDGVFRITYTDD